MVCRGPLGEMKDRIAVGQQRKRGPGSSLVTTRGVRTPGSYTLKWQVYVDNWDAGTVGPGPEVLEMIGKPDGRQLAIRSAWERSGIPRSEDKALEGAFEGVSLGKEFNGRAGWNGATVERWQNRWERRCGSQGRTKYEGEPLG